MNASPQLYILENDQQRGPYTEEELRVRLSNGTAFKGTLIWREGLSNWTRLEDYLEAIPTSPDETPKLEPTRERNIFHTYSLKGPKWPRVCFSICCFLFLASMRWQSSIEKEARPYIAEYNRMNSTAYNVDVGAEAFIRGFLGDPMGKANEETSKSNSIEARLAQLSADYDSASTSTGLFFLLTVGFGITWIAMVIRHHKAKSTL